MPQLLTLAAAGKIGSIDTRGGVPYFSLTAAQATTYAPVLALANTPYLLSQLILAADLPNPVLDARFTNFTVQDSVANILANLPQIQALAAAGQLGRLTYTDAAPRLVIGAATIMAGADAFGAQDFNPYPVVLTDAGTPVITLASYQLNYNMRNDTLDPIAGPWTLHIAGLADPGTLAAIAEEQNGVLAHLSGPVNVAAYSYDVSRYIDQLEYLAEHGDLTTVKLIDGGTPVLSVTAAQAAGDTALLGAGGLLQGQFLLSVVCFAAGTRIATPDGEVAVEVLRPGDHVLTLGAATSRPVVWIGRRQVDLARHPTPELAQPIRIRKHAFGGNVPHRDLWLSPEHCVFTDGVLIPTRLLVNGGSIARDTGFSEITYFHVELDRHAVLLSEGLATESYLDTGNRGRFDNTMDEASEPAGWKTDSCARLAVDPATVEPIWRRLHERGTALGFVAVKPVTTTDADLRLEADGETRRPIFVRDGWHGFLLGREARTARLVSRSARPQDARPWLDDRRRLGVRVERIVVGDGAARVEIPVDHPELEQGWWQAEGTGRWTDGAAILNLPAGTRRVEVKVAGEMYYQA